MGIVGGALIPPIQGLVADMTTLQFSFFIPVLCYLYIVFYGLKGAIPNSQA
jgi:FHS family L-fucose permease-like MFS transporter